MLLALPFPSTPLPREKPLPVEKPQTKWQQFAAKKGIEPKKRGDKLVFDEEKGEWLPKWGFKGANKKGEGDWLVEMDDGKEVGAEEVDDGVRGLGRRERKDRVKRNERRMKANQRRVKKSGG